MKVKGNAIKYGDNVDTDVIIPARHLITTDPLELARYCMEDIDSSFVKRVRAGDIMVAGRNFGCGSSREHAPIAIKASGISCIIAKTFARIFYRNAINIGLPIIESEAAADEAQDGDVLEIDLSSGIIKNLTKGREYATSPFPPFMQKIIDNNGMIESIKNNKF